MRRVVYLGRHLMLKSKYLDKVGSGRFTTIRLGIVRPKYREVFVHSGGMVVAKARIVDVRYKRVKELTNEDAMLDGFANKEELIQELKRLYGDVSENDWVTILTLEVVKPLGIKDDGTVGLSPVDIARLALRYNVHLTDDEKKVLQEVVNQGSIRKAAIRLFGGLKGRIVIRKIIRKALKQLVAMGVLKGDVRLLDEEENPS